MRVLRQKVGMAGCKANRRAILLGFIWVLNAFEPVLGGQKIQNFAKILDFPMYFPV
jgi:hypothetical protein